MKKNKLYIVVGDDPSEKKYKELFVEIHVDATDAHTDVIATISREEGCSKMKIEFNDYKHEINEFYLDEFIEVLEKAKKLLG